MPIYAYECKDCGVRFERRQSFTDDPIRVCPECEGTTHRLIQPAGVIFKGSGFYSTDNRSSKSGSGGKTDGKSDAKTESKSEGGSSETKSESKPAEAKSEPKPAKAAAD